jgi:NAD(P)H-flavin reductase
VTPDRDRATPDLTTPERLDGGAHHRATSAGDLALGGLLHHGGRRRVRRGGSDPAAGPAAPPTTDGPDGDSPGHVLSVEAVGDSVRILRVGRPPGFAFRSGQYARVGVGEGKGRKFSIASAPHEPHLEFCVELRPGGRVTPELFRLRPGDPVTIDATASGDFLFDESARRHLMVATVTGIAPLRSMLLDALHRDTVDEITLLHGASYGDELPYLEELRELAVGDRRLRYEPTVSRPAEPRNARWNGHTGRVDALAEDLAVTHDPRTTRVYAAGNAGMVRNVADSLGAMGFTVFTEAY